MSARRHLLLCHAYCGVMSLSLSPGREIGSLLRRGGIDGAYSYSVLDAGFCNDVFKVQVETLESPLVVKFFSGMAKTRCPAALRGVVDVAVGSAGLGPRIVLRTDDALVSEFVPGDTLVVEDVRRDECGFAIGEIAPRLAELHALPAPACVPSAPASLWRGVDAMLEVIGAAETSHTSPAPPLKARILIAEAQRMRWAVDSVACADVLGHGDLKPSNA